jgi:hypothetical protein
MTVLKQTLIIAMIVPAVAGMTLAVTDEAQATHEGWETWAKKWNKEAKKQRAVYVRAADARGVKRPQTLRPRADFETWQAWGDHNKRHAQNWRDNWIPYHVGKMKRPGGSGAARWWPLASYVGWPKAQRANFIKCVKGESRGNPTATNGTCHGLMQIHRTHGLAKPFDPEHNIRKGLQIWKKQGWRPWSVMR